MNKFTVYWLTGDREVLEGETIANAFTLGGYGGGAINAVDFFTFMESYIII